MNSSKRSTLTVLIIVAIVIVGGIIWFGNSSSAPSPSEDGVTSPLAVANGSSTPVAVSETVKVSGSLSEYQNAELGFSVKYPSSWEKEETNAGVTFIVPVDKNQVSTVATLQSNIQVLSGKCAFPPVTSVKDRGTITVGSDSLDTVSMSNTVQGRTYSNRMYSLQKSDICYMFSFASITLSPSSKGLSGSNVTQADNNNKAIVSTADSDFTSMVKSFAFVSTPAGTDETKAAPAK